MRPLIHKIFPPGQSRRRWAGLMLGLVSVGLVIPAVHFLFEHHDSTGDCAVCLLLVKSFAALTIALRLLADNGLRKTRCCSFIARTSTGLLRPSLARAPPLSN